MYSSVEKWPPSGVNPWNWTVRSRSIDTLAGSFSEAQHDVNKKSVSSAQSAVQVATVRGYSGRQDWTARSQAYLPNFSQPDSVGGEAVLMGANGMLKKRRQGRSGNWNQNCSIGAQGRSTHNG